MTDFNVKKLTTIVSIFLWALLHSFIIKADETPQYGGTLVVHYANE